MNLNMRLNTKLSEAATGKGMERVDKLEGFLEFFGLKRSILI